MKRLSLAYFPSSKVFRSILIFASTAGFNPGNRLLALPTNIRLARKKNWQAHYFPGMVGDEERQVLKLLPQINFANMKLLQGLPAIGPKTAYLIQSYR
jgi:DNA uptake protein ComE-like DNA-binding protein